MISRPVVCVLSGAAGGIGRATAQRLADHGTHLALLDSDPAVREVASNLSSVHNVHAVGIVTDVSSEDEVSSAFEAAADLGDLRHVVHAAAILQPSRIADTDLSVWERHLTINATGTFLVLRQAARHLSTGGSVVTVTSNSARVPRVAMGPYAASKAASDALTRTLALELASSGIRCNTVEPGSTETSMQRDLWPDPDVGRRAAIDGDLATFRLGIPLGRIASPENIAGTVAFLLSDDASHITCQRIRVDGGATP